MSKKNIAPEFTDDVNKAEQIESAAPAVDAPEAPEVAEETVEESAPELEESAPQVEDSAPTLKDFEEVAELEGKLKVKFIANPIGFNLSYNIGDVAELPTGQAEFLIKAQIAEIC